MKTFIPFLLLLSTYVMANELAWVDEQVEAIKPPRKGISKQEITSLKDPFIFLKTKKTNNKNVKHTSVINRKTSKSTYRRVHSYKLSLEAVMNKSAFINGKWYKEGEKVKGYLLKEVNARSVLLTKGKKQLTLTTMSKNKKLKFKNN